MCHAVKGKRINKAKDDYSQGVAYEPEPSGAGLVLGFGSRFRFAGADGFDRLFSCDHRFLAQAGRRGQLRPLEELNELGFFQGFCSIKKFAGSAHDVCIQRAQLVVDVVQDPKKQENL